MMICLDKQLSLMAGDSGDVDDRDMYFLEARQ